MTETDIKLAIKVIRQAKKLGVKSMKLGTLEFELLEVEKKTPRPRPTLKVSKKVIEQQQADDVEQFELTAAMDELATMNVEDPVAFETAIIENELIGDGTNGDDLEETQSI